jgi:hypothetical protein
VIRGSGLCGGVRFEIAKAVGPFELCHCNRCRKASGSAFTAFLGVEAARVLEKAGLKAHGLYERRIVRPNLGPDPRPSLYFSRRR